MIYKVLVDNHHIEDITTIKELSEREMVNLEYAWAKARDISVNGVRLLKK